MRSATWIGVALFVCGCSSAPDAALERRVAALEQAIDTDAELGSLTQHVDRELSHITDVSSLNSTLDDASVSTLMHAVAAIEKRRAACIENLANSQTHTFKRRVTVQNDLEDVSVTLDFEQGTLELTDRQLDCAIHGQGFFRVRVSDNVGDGTAYTRSGNFFVNAEGDLVLGQRAGPRLVPAMTLPSNTTDVNIAEDGRVSVVVSGSSTPMQIGQLELSRFINPQGLRAIADNLYLETSESGAPLSGNPETDSMGGIQQNTLEASNVDTTRERLLLLRADRERALVERLLERAEGCGPTSQPVSGSAR